MENTDSRVDSAAIKHVVARLEHAQQHELPDEFMSLLRADAVWVTAHGKRLTGWDEINAFTQMVLPGAMSDSMATYTVVNTLFIRPDVAVVNVHQRPVALDGEPLDAQEGRPMYVMSKEDNGWKIAAAQNTLFIDN